MAGGRVSRAANVIFVEIMLSWFNVSPDVDANDADHHHALLRQVTKLDKCKRFRYGIAI